MTRLICSLANKLDNETLCDRCSFFRTESDSLEIKRLPLESVDNFHCGFDGEQIKLLCDTEKNSGFDTEEGVSFLFSLLCHLSPSQTRTEIARKTLGNFLFAKSEKLPEKTVTFFAKCFWESHQNGSLGIFGQNSTEKVLGAFVDRFDEISWGSSDLSLVFAENLVSFLVFSTTSFRPPHSALLKIIKIAIHPEMRSFCLNKLFSLSFSTDPSQPLFGTKTCVEIFFILFSFHEAFDDITNVLFNVTTLEFVSKHLKHILTEVIIRKNRDAFDFLLNKLSVSSDTVLVQNCVFIIKTLLLRENFKENLHFFVSLADDFNGKGYSEALEKSLKKSLFEVLLVFDEQCENNATELLLLCERVSGRKDSVSVLVYSHCLPILDQGIKMVSRGHCLLEVTTVLSRLLKVLGTKIKEFAPKVTSFLFVLAKSHVTPLSSDTNFVDLFLTVINDFVTLNGNEHLVPAVLVLDAFFSQKKPLSHKKQSKLPEALLRADNLFFFPTSFENFKPFSIELEERVNSFTFEQKLSMFSSHLYNSAGPVKKGLMKQFLRFVGQNRTELYSFIANIEPSGSDLKVKPLENIVQSLLAADLSDSQLVTLSAECLGEIGAIAPYFFSSFKKYNPPLHPSFPTEFFECQNSLALFLLNNFLSPLLKNCPHAQVLFASQELLKLLEINDQTPLQHRKIAKVRKKMKKGPVNWDCLSADVKNVVTPLLSSSYVLRRNKTDNLSELVAPSQTLSLVIKQEKGCIDENSSIFDTSNSYTEWIEKWSFHLIDQLNGLTGNKKSVFEAIKTVFKLDEKLATSAMPALIIALMAANNETKNEISEEIKNEFLAVLSSTTYEKGSDRVRSLRCIRFVFHVCDALEKWVESKSSPSNQNRKRKQPQEKSVESVVSELLNSIPRLLMAEAAAKSQFYCKAVLLIESEWRKRPQVATDQRIIHLLHECFDKAGQVDLMIAASKMKEEVPLQLSVRNKERCHRWTEALHIYEQLLQENPSCVRSKKGLLRCLVRLGHYRTVITQAHGTYLESPKHFKSIAKYGVSAAWRLQQWDSLETLLCHEDAKKLYKFDSFEKRLGAMLCCLRENDRRNFEKMLLDTRKTVMQKAVLLNTESYLKAFPQVLRLSLLQELRQGALLFFGEKQVSGPISVSFNNSLLEKRLDILPDDFESREPLLALRRVLLGLGGLVKEEGLSWIRVAKEARRSGMLSVARGALMSAKIMDVPADSLYIERAKILRSSDSTFEALELLESNLNQSPDPGRVKLLYAKMCISSRAKKASEIVYLLENARETVKGEAAEEKVCYLMGKYYDFLLNKRLSSGSKASSLLQQMLYHSLLSYSEAIRRGVKFLFAGLPRMLFLYFEYCSGRNMKLDPSGKVAKLFSTLSTQVDEFKWYNVIPQLIANMSIEEKSIASFIKMVLIRVFTAFPHQMCWHLLPRAEFSVFDCRYAAKKIVEELKTTFQRLNSPLLALINSAEQLFANLRVMANKKMSSTSTQDKFSIRKVFPALPLTRAFEQPILVPTLSNMTITSPSADWDMPHLAKIDKIADEFVVFFSKEMPIRISFTGTDGKQHMFLLKVETRGDLRKDSNMSQLFSVVNRLLSQSPITRTRNIRLRAFNVALLTESCGLIQWVPNTCTFKAACNEIEPGLYTLKRCATICGGKKNVESKTKSRKEKNLRLLLQSQRPVFGDWLLKQFRNPEEWLQAQLNFVRSTAVASMMGFVIGLGDRHGENILIDTANGECVHVDFDCIFEKGKRLPVPEVVPFRLTQNVIDGFGITGMGVFITACESILRVFRKERETLLAVLHSFAADPLLEHTKGSEQFRGQSVKSVLGEIKSKLDGCVVSDSIPLSVEGQVRSLIKKATDFNSLSAMFFGWMPSL